jgi:hypothetical protein
MIAVDPKTIVSSSDAKLLKEAAHILFLLEQKGLKEVSIASGWTRKMLCKLDTVTDIDIAYVGTVHYEDAQKLLNEILEELKPENKKDWDVRGIWNAEMAMPHITTISDHYLRDYVCSIDSVYLASDGLLHDASGFGIADSRNGILRLHDYNKKRFKNTDRTIAYTCLEGIRRIALFGWKPTVRSAELIADGAKVWPGLTLEKKEDLYKKRLLKKFKVEDLVAFKPIYAKYGWGFLIDEALDFAGKP